MHMDTYRIAMLIATYIDVITHKDTYRIAMLIAT